MKLVQQNWNFEKQFSDSYFTFPTWFINTKFRRKNHFYKGPLLGIWKWQSGKDSRYINWHNKKIPYVAGSACAYFGGTYAGFDGWGGEFCENPFKPVHAVCQKTEYPEPEESIEVSIGEEGSGKNIHFYVMSKTWNHPLITQ